MQYLLMTYETPENFANREGEAAEAYMAEWMSYVDAIHQSGIIVSSGGLQPPDTATTVTDPGRRALRAGRPLRRLEGAARRLLPDRRARPRHRARVGGPVAVRIARRRRGASADPPHGLTRPNSSTRTGRHGDRRAITSGGRGGGAHLLRPPARLRRVPDRRSRRSRGRVGRRVEQALRIVARADGVPDRPEAWLLTVARRRLIAGARHGTWSRPRRAVAATAGRRGRRLAERTDVVPRRSTAAALRVRASRHRPPSHAPLMLQTVLRVDAARIASAFLVSPATMGQRLVRAKTKIRDAGHRLPDPRARRASRSARLGPRRDLCRLRDGLGRRHRRPGESGSRRRGDPAGTAGGRPDAGRAGARGLLALLLFSDSPA